MTEIDAERIARLLLCQAFSTHTVIAIASSRQIIAFLVALVLIRMVPALIGQTGKVYLFGTILPGSYFLLHVVRLTRNRTNAMARRLVLASVLYLPLVFGLMMFDKLWF